MRCFPTITVEEAPDEINLISFYVNYEQIQGSILQRVINSVIHRHDNTDLIQAIYVCNIADELQRKQSSKKSAIYSGYDNTKVKMRRNKILELQKYSNLIRLQRLKLHKTGSYSTVHWYEMLAGNTIEYKMEHSNAQKP